VANGRPLSRAEGVLTVHAVPAVRRHPRVVRADAPPRAEDEDGHGIDGGVHGARGVGVGQPVQRVQGECGALAWRQAPEGRPDRALVFGRQRHVHRRRPARPIGEDVGQGRVERGLARRATAHPVEGRGGGDTVQPSGEGPVPAQSGQGAKGAQERVLREVLGLGVVAADAVGDGVDVARVAVDKAGEGVLLPVQMARDERVWASPSPSSSSCDTTCVTIVSCPSRHILPRSPAAFALHSSSVRAGDAQ